MHCIAPSETLPYCFETSLYIIISAFNTLHTHTPAGVPEAGLLPVPGQSGSVLLSSLSRTEGLWPSAGVSAVGCVLSIAFSYK